MSSDRYWLVPVGRPGSGDTTIAVATPNMPVAFHLPNRVDEPQSTSATLAEPA